ncbi:putative NADH dehydrogenase domain protein [Mycobacterium xenopi 4042]|uniref:Putative NADH dehydrogenase domain protein n=1 Tax=Mycobacterium xenopi 4042 TaxID=1299334 RepID=X8AEN5_MYCXE|nr:putative NADH dehydrogenase domain protein [Mycobacterium xenopi 4042]
MLTLTGAGRRRGLYELPLGLPFTEVLALHGVSTEQVQGVLMGGYFAGLLNRVVLDATLDYETLRGWEAGWAPARSRY